MCLAHASGLLIAVALMAALTLELAAALYFDRTDDGDRSARASLRAFAAGAAIMLAGMTAAIVQASPPPDAAFGHPAKLSFRSSDARQLASALIDGYLPVPIDRRSFWNSNAFLSSGTPKQPPPLRIADEHRVAVACLLVAFGALVVASRPWALVPFAIGTAAQLAFTHMYHYGSVRHHGFVFLVLVVSLWISDAHAPARPIPTADDHSGPIAAFAARARSFLDRYRVHAFSVLLAVHAVATGVAVKNDWMYPFSQGRAAAEWLGHMLPDREGTTFVGDRSPVATTVVGYLELPGMYYPDRSEFGSYILFDRRRLRHRSRTLAEEVDGLIAAEPKPVVLVLSRSLTDDDGLGPRARLLERFDHGIVGDEHYWIYVVRPDAGKSPT